MKLYAWSMLGLLMLGTPVTAQEVINSPDYHARHNASSVYYQGPRQQQPQPPPQPTGYWENTWGAIATSETGGALGTAVGASDKTEAEQSAMADCKAKGGGGCRVDLAYSNQCAAMVVGEGSLVLYSAGSIEKASARGINDCKKDGDNCRVYYSACTEPIFHPY